MSKPSKKSAFLRLFTITVFIILASIDNSVLDMASSVYDPMSIALKTTGIFFHTEDAWLIYLGIVNAVLIWIVAGVAIWWGYLGDKGNRKKLLLIGTLIWSSSLAFTPLVSNEISWLVVQCVAGFGLACIASVGFSVIVDFVSPEKRGAALGFWGLSQGIGTGLGKAIAAITVKKSEPQFWWVPFLIFSVVGFVMIFFYFFTLDPKRGATEKELVNVEYDYKIKKADLGFIFKKRTNLIIMLTGLIGQIGWGALTFLATAFTKLFTMQGLDEAVLAGNVVAGLLAIGGIFSIPFGALSDKLQRRTLKARPYISGVTTLLGIPFFIGMLLVPFDLSALAGVKGTLNALGGMINQLGVNLPFLFMFLMSIGAAALMSANSPNWFAMIGDVNLPEHRGTMFGFGNFINGIGRGIGSILVPVIAAALVGTVPEPFNLMWAIVICMFSFIPMGMLCFVAGNTLGPDYYLVKETLARRAGELKARIVEK